MNRILILFILLLTRCSSGEPGVSAPTITTQDPVDITLSSASISAVVEHAESDQITMKGVCWSANPAPVLDVLSSKTENGPGAGSFTALLRNLSVLKYYVRAYARIGNQVFYGNEVILDIRLLVPALTVTRKGLMDATTVLVETSIVYTHSLPILEKGICWNSTGSPSVTNDSKATDTGTTLTFQSQVTSLQQWTSYYVRPYAITSLGTFYGNDLQVLILPPVSYGSVSDVDGNTYPTTTINGKVWMAENLKVTHYNDGSAITPSNSGTEFKNMTEGSYIAYDNQSGNVNDFGYLYNGYVVSGAKNVCMTGWHVPSPSEWMQLTQSLGGAETAGGRMKAVSGLWTSPNVSADNESGFSAVPGGSYCRICSGNSGIFADMGTDAYWWSTATGTFFYVTNDLASIRTKSTANINDGLSVRCVKD